MRMRPQSLPAVAAIGYVSTIIGTAAFHLSPAMLLAIILIEHAGLAAAGLLQVLIQRQRNATAVELLQATDGPVSVTLHADGEVEILRP